jgi:hypothetical protein
LQDDTGTLAEKAGIIRPSKEHAIENHISRFGTKKQVMF